MKTKTKSKARNDYVHIAVILDRTGSMESIRDDIIGGFNTFLKKQQAEPGKATFTLVQFDSQDPYEVICKFTPIADVQELTRETFVPRASTPLLDAMGRGINDLDESLAKMTIKTRPDRIVMVIITDGQENASQEFTKGQVEAMIKAKQEKSDWQFVFLSADLAAVGDAVKSGVKFSSSMAFDKNAHGTSSAMCSASERIADYRSLRAEAIAFSEEDRAKQKSEKKR
jgi:Mg-chelatase subunit ChlD